MQAFVQSFGQGIFGDYCAACHQQNGGGVMGHYPNLIDDAWLWGGEVADIENSIKNGRKGSMPAHKGTLAETEITDLGHYVLSLSGESKNVDAAAKGKVLFEGKGACFACHTKEATGMKALGSANLTDQIWTIADVKGLKIPEEKLAAVTSVIANGVKREMPAWKTRLDDMQIKVLTAYISSLSAVKNAE
jgi:cytochrome c oxidase cbb3-type subunit 3